MIRTYLLVFYKLRWLSKRNFRNIGIDPLLPKKYFDILNNFLNIYYSWTFLIYESPVSNFLENSSRFFPKFQFPGHELDRFLENSSINFLWVPIINIGAWARPISGKLVHIWMSFPETGLCHAAWLMPQNTKIDDWMSFP